jgi:hypothetical protein
LKLRELLRDLVSDEIRPRTEHLPELDERRPEIGEGEPEAYWCGKIDDLLARRSAQPPLHAFARDLLQPVREPIPNGDADDFPEAACVAIALAPSYPPIAQRQ